MSVEGDLEIIKKQPSVKIWGEDLDEIQLKKIYKGKFVVTDEGQLFAKLYPKAKWEIISFFHDMVVQELGVQDAENMDIKDVLPENEYEALANTVIVDYEE